MASWDTLYSVDEVLRDLSEKHGFSYVLSVTQYDPKTKASISRGWAHIQEADAIPTIENHMGEFFEELYEEGGFPPAPDFDEG